MLAEPEPTQKYSRFIETASVSNDISNYEEPDFLPSICQLPNGNFSVANIPSLNNNLDSTNDESNDTEDDENENGEFERILLYILLSDPPNGNSIMIKRWKYATIIPLLSVIDSIMLIIAAFGSHFSFEKVTSDLVILCCIFAIVANFFGSFVVSKLNVRGMSILIIILFNRAVITLLFMPTIWFIMTVPTGTALLFITFLLRNTFFSSWFPAIV